MDSNTTFDDEFMTDQEVMAEFGPNISGDEFMTDQEVMAEFGSKPSDDEFMTDSEVLEEFEKVFEKVETVVEEAKSGDAKDEEEEATDLMVSVDDEKSDKASSTTDSEIAQANTAASEFPRNAQTVDDYHAPNYGVVGAFGRAKAARVKFLQTKRGFGLIKLQDPPEVEVVKEAIRRLHLQLMNKVAQNDADYAFQIESICIAYDRLRKSCHEFVGKYEAIKKPSRKEKQWLDLSKEIEEQSDRELGEFMELKRAYILGNRTDGKTWTEVLAKIRSNGSFIPDRSKEIEYSNSSDVIFGVLDKKKKVYVKKADRVADSEKTAFGKKATEFSAATRAGIDSGMTVSDRNVSSTRLAERLGVSDLLARSETVFFEKTDGRVVREVYKVNSMEAFTGKNVMDMFELAQSVKNPGKLYGKKITFSAKAAKQMFDLQVIDLIAGQIDRHFHNVLACYEISGNDVVIKGIKGIDNDLAFGKIDATKQVDRLLPISDTDYDADGNVVKKKTGIPFISRELYDRLMTPGMDLVLKYDQLDLRSEPEIKALLDRFTYIRNEIKDLHDRGLLQIIDDEEEFEKQFIERMRSMQKTDQLIPSYMTSYVMERIFQKERGNFMEKWSYQ